MVLSIAIIFKILSFLFVKILLNAVLKSIFEITGSTRDNFGTQLNITKAQKNPNIVIKGILGIPKN